MAEIAKISYELEKYIERKIPELRLAAAKTISRSDLSFSLANTKDSGLILMAAKINSRSDLKLLSASFFRKS